VATGAAIAAILPKASSFFLLALVLPNSYENT
jgi:hypothetical protein